MRGGSGTMAAVWKLWRLHRCGLLVVAMATFPGLGAAASPFDETTVERALSCSDLDALQVTIKALVGGMVEPINSGLVRRERFTKLDDESGLVGEYRLLQPFKVLGRPLLGISNALGMLPALTALFDDRLGSLQRVYERAGFRFQCKKVAELDGESCEARRDVPAGAAPPGEPLMYVVILTESPELLKYGRTLVTCTVLPREGNPFR